MWKPRKIVKVDKLTRKPIAVYQSVHEAAEKEGVCTKTISRHCANSRIGNETYYLRYVDEFNPNEVFMRFSTRGLPIVVVDWYKRKPMIFPSMNRAVFALRIEQSALSYSIGHGGVPVMNGRYSAAAIPGNPTTTVKGIVTNLYERWFEVKS